MKKKRIMKISALCCLAAGMILSPAGQMNAQAVEAFATVQGSVMKGTTTDLLKLATKEGNMEIKLDSSTDASGCKVLLPGYNVSVSVAHGSDEYLHAVTITSGLKSETISLDTSKYSTVSGTISEKSKDGILYVKTPQGEMEIKLDATTDMSGCTVLVADKTYQITCVRGSDAYMHATAITDSSGGGLGSGSTASTVPASSLTPAPESTVGVDTTTVTGTVNKKTTSDRLFLETQYGQMEIAIDQNTDSRGGIFLMPDRKLSVAVYRGSDAVMHAATIVAAKESVIPVTVDTSSPATVTGIVSSKSTENIMFLKTNDGEMELKLDNVRSVTGCKVLVKGRKVTVTCVRGSDAYMHALDIIGN
ncbi:MAG: hypothetical protein K2N43_07085 [Lachnospiraceae bacterium]|nr:hypothetical protein [Lachnospiraceae bacterium]